MQRGEVGLVRDRVVVNDAGQVRRGNHGLHVRLHLAPVGGVEVGRQDHQAAAAVVLGGLGDVDGFLGGKRGDARDDRGVRQGFDVGLLQRQLFLERQRGALAQRAVDDDGGATAFDEPFAMLRHQGVVDGHVGVELREGGGHDAFPSDAHDGAG